MYNLLDNIPGITLMGPGPSSVAPSTYHALSRPTLGHMDPYFIKIMDEVKSGLRTLMGTSNEFTLPMSGTGSIGMEAAFVNTIERGDKVLVLINGVFGQRMADVAGRLGAEVDTIDFEWGTPVLVDKVAEQLKKKHYDIVSVIHAETSTGVLNPVQQIGDLIKGSDTLYIVDAVTSLGGMPVEVDKWGADVCYSGTQKCLSCPPGLAPITFSERAVQKIKNRKSKVPNWYLDMNMLIQYWGGSTRVYHHTGPINMVYGLYQSIINVLDEGLDKVFLRHRQVRDRLESGLIDLGMDLLVEKPYRLISVNVPLVPAGVKDAEVRARLMNDYKIEIGGGLGPLAGKIFRIGVMGYTATNENVDRLLGALREILK